MTHTLSLAACLAAICTLLSPVLHAEEAPKPVVISLSEVGDFTTKYGHEAASLLRPRIITRLVTDYDCVVLNRSICDTLTTESFLNRMKAMTDKGSDAGAVLAADFAIRAHICAAKEPGHADVFLYLQDLRRDEERAPQKLTWKVKVNCFAKTTVFDSEEVAKSITQKIAEALSLNKKAETKADNGTGKPSGGGQKWAVLPFTRLDAGKIYDQPACAGFYNKIMNSTTAPQRIDVEKYHCKQEGEVKPYQPISPEKYEERLNEYKNQIENAKNAYNRTLEEIRNLSKPVNGDTVLSSASELALQNDGQTLVDRTSLNKVLAEIKLKNIEGLNENIGGHIARLAGADRILLGTVAKAGESYTVMLQLVDAKTSVIIDAVEAFCPSEDKLTGVVHGMTVDIVRRIHQAPAISLCAKWQRQREAAFYREELPYLHNRRDIASKPAWLNCIEINYLLMHDEPDYIAEKTVPWLREMLSCRETRLEVYVRGVAMLDAMLQSYEALGSIRSPILIRANAYLSSWQYEKALVLVDEHKKLNPDADRDWADYIVAECRYRIGRHQEAILLAKEIVDRSEKSGCRRYDHIRKTKRSNSYAWEESHYEKALNLLVEIAQDDQVRDEELEYYAMKKGGQYYVLEEFRYMALVKKFEGIEKTINLFPRHVTDKGLGGSYFVVIDLLAADNLLEMGRKDEAIQIYKNVADHWYLDQYPLSRLAALLSRENVSEIKTKEDKRNDQGLRKYKNAAEVCPVPEKYKIYCYPVVGSDSNLVKRICKQFGEWAGTGIVIKDALPCPVNTLMKEEEVHDVQSFSRQLLQDLAIPDDAVFVFFVAPRMLFLGDYLSGRLLFPVGGNPVLLAPERLRYGDQEAVAALYNALLNCILEPLSLEWNGWMRGLHGRGEGFRRDKQRCNEKDCLGRPGPLRSAMKDLTAPSLLMCEKCWKKCATADWGACHEALHAFMKRDFKMLSNGLNARPDFLDELNWHDPEVIEQTRSSVEAGSPKGLYLMGLVYNNGLGIAGDEEKALASFKQCYGGLIKLAEANDADAANYLGRMYLNGYGVPVKHEEAFKWFKQAAEQGHPRSQLDLGKMCYDGQGTKKDPEAGMRWARVAAEQGYAFAQNWIGRRFCGTKEPRPKDYPQAEKWFRKSADEGNLEGIVLLGDLYRLGRGVPKDLNKAVDLYAKAAHMDCAEAIHRMSWVFYFACQKSPFDVEIPAEEIPWKYTVRYPEEGEVGSGH